LDLLIVASFFLHVGLISFCQNRLKTPAIVYVFVFSIDIHDRAHQGFGWVGEWANTRFVVNLDILIFVGILLTYAVRRKVHHNSFTDVAVMTSMITPPEKVTRFVCRHFIMPTRGR